MNCVQAFFASITFALLVDGSTAQGCGHHGHVDGQKCVCNHGYAGTHCEIQCQNGGTQRNDDPTRCHCSEGWAGKACAYIDCNHGHFDRSDHTQCQCESGWTGEHCDQNVCGNHGYWNGSQCVCNHHLTGAHCDISCNNGGTQSPTHPLRCHCGHEWAGITCDIHCTNGEQDHTDQNGCHCNNGWTGISCDQKVTTTTTTTPTTTAKPTTTATTTPIPTAPTVCGDHGHWDGHKCVCNQGYAGTHCEIHCLNGGLQSTHFPARCDCPTEFAGRNCAIECNHGHYDPSHPHICHCDSGWTGLHCAQNVATTTTTTTTTSTTTTTTAATTTTSTTTPIPTTLPVCGYHGYWDGHKCVCNQGHAGTHCEILCVHGGIQSTLDPTRCLCPTQFAGRICAIECKNGHYDQSDYTKCHCDLGWTGTQCDQTVTTTTKTTSTTTTTTAAATATTATTTQIPTTPPVPICSKVNGSGPFTHSNATPCPTAEKGSHEALVLNHCLTVPHNTSSWQPGQHVTPKHCDDLSSKNAAVATFVNSRYIRDGGLSGLVVSCLIDGFQLMVQGCGFGVITLNITTGGINLFDPGNYYTIQ